MPLWLYSTLPSWSKQLPVSKCRSADARVPMRALLGSKQLPVRVTQEMEGRAGVKWVDVHVLADSVPFTEGG